MRRSTMVRRWVVSHPLPPSRASQSSRHGGTGAGMSAHCMHWCSDGAGCSYSPSKRHFVFAVPLTPSVVEIVVRVVGERLSIGCASSTLGAPSDDLFFSACAPTLRREKQGSTLASIPTRQARCIFLVPGQLSHVGLVDLSSEVQPRDSRG